MSAHAERLRAWLDAATPPQPWALDRVALRRLWLGSAAFAAALLIAFAAGGYHAGFAALNALGRTAPERLLQSVTYLGDTLCVLAGVLIFAARRRDVLWTGFVAGVLGSAFSRVPKSLFNAARPPAVLEEAARFVSGPALTSHSFPSGHTVSIFVGAGMVLYFARSATLRLAMLALALLVGASRVTVGVHWPLDVLGGAAIGLAAVAVAVRLSLRWQRHATFRVQVVQALLLGGCAIALGFVRIAYPLARPEGLVLATLALATLAWHYAIAPRRNTDST